MKLYIYDGKHEKIISQMDLPANADLNYIQKIIDWLESNGMTGRYNELVLANNYNVEYIDGGRYIDFN